MLNNNMIFNKFSPFKQSTRKKIKMKQFFVNSVIYDKKNFIVVAGGDLHEDILNIPNYKQYVKDAFNDMNAYFKKEFNLDAVLGPLHFEEGKFGIVIFVHKSMTSLKEVQTILNIVFEFTQVDYALNLPCELENLFIEDLGITYMRLFVLPGEDGNFLNVLRIKTVSDKILTFHVVDNVLPDDTSDLPFIFAIFQELLPLIKNYGDLKAEPTWLVPDVLQYYIIPEEVLDDEFEMAFMNQSHVIKEFITKSMHYNNDSVFQ